MIKQLTILFLSSLLILSLYSSAVAQTQTPYPDTIERQIKDNLKEKGMYFDSSKPVNIVKMVKTPKKHYYIVLFTYSPYHTDHLGDAIFKKEESGYIFVGGMSSTSQKLNNTTMYLGKVPYSVVYGFNEENRIKTLRLFTLDKKSSYTAPIKKGTYFVHFKKLPYHTDLEKIEPFFIDCYGKDNKLIPWAECAE
ncbi:hypothetical protein [Priestia megaterium]|uniref:hypothetical protein n=1 Tax=Priestia megaterium TaxID=1404 RepID=UPI00237A2DB8|nr:hypothetical protein [Priestia megaterium]MDD9791540.1 hypothetical protein [Priestia megaterium]